MAKTLLTQDARDEVLRSRLSEMTHVVRRELAGIPLFQAPEDDAAPFARAFINNLLRRGIAPDNMKAEIESLKIADTVNSLRIKLGAHVADVYQYFRSSKGSFFNRTETIEKKIKLVAQLLVDGHLPMPEKTQEPSYAEAVSTTLTNSTYGVLANKDEKQIHAVALLTCLAGCTVSETFTLTAGSVTVKKTNDDRANEIAVLLSGISDARWEHLASIAAKAGIERPAPTPDSPDRYKIVLDAIAARKTKAAPGEP